MDINYLLAREQISIMRANAAGSPEARLAHAGLARGYGARLAETLFPHRRYRATAANELLPPSENPDMGRAEA